MKEFLFYNRITESCRYVQVFEEYNPEGYWIDDNFYLYFGTKLIYASNNKEDLIQYIKRNNPDLLTQLNLAVQQNKANNVNVGEFNPEDLRNIKSYSAKVKYCDGLLERIGSGSSRVVYKINDQKVLKLAKNAKGLAQNETEIQQGYDYYLKGLVAEVYEYDEDNVWIVAEFCHKVTQKRFKELTGISFKDYKEAVWYGIANAKGSRYKPSKPKVDYSENELVSNIIDYSLNYDIPHGDLIRISSYGINSKGNVVLTDYGLTDDVFQEHYSKMR